MINRLTRLPGGGRKALCAAALLNGLPFGVIHYERGIGGIVLTAVMGSVMGIMFLAVRRNIWPPIFAHATMNAVLVAQLYFTLGRELI